jgi:hypothetical protein
MPFFAGPGFDSRRLDPQTSSSILEIVMNKIFHSVAAIAIPLAGLTGFAGSAQAQAEDWLHVATACTPASLDSLAVPQFNTAGGFIRAPLGNGAPRLRYTCNVLDSFATFVPVWNFMVMQYFDPAGGSISATLYSKNRITGVTAVEAFVPSAAAGAVANVVVAVPALNFAVNQHYIVIEMIPQPNVRVQAHMVKLVQ